MLHTRGRGHTSDKGCMYTTVKLHYTTLNYVKLHYATLATLHYATLHTMLHSTLDATCYMLHPTHYTTTTTTLDIFIVECSLVRVRITSYR